MRDGKGFERDTGKAHRCFARSCIYEPFLVMRQMNYLITIFEMDVGGNEMLFAVLCPFS